MSYNVIRQSNDPNIETVPNDITLAEFETIAATCNRWEPRSLTVVRALLIDGRSLTKVANENNMTAQQANVLRTRFMAKLPDKQLAEFRKRVKPQGKPSKPNKISSRLVALQELQNDGYTVEQMIEYLASHDIKATATEIRKALQGAKS